MPKTTVGLFADPGVVEEVVREIETLGFPRNEVRVLDEPPTFPVTGVMSFARLDFEVDLVRELTRIGATKAEAQGYVQGLRRGGELVFATGSDEKVDMAADIMNRRGAVEIEETTGPEPHLPACRFARTPFSDDPIASVMAGRIRQAGTAAPAYSSGDETGPRLTNIEEHRGFFATKGRKARSLEEMLLAGNREQFFDSPGSRTLFAKLNQPGRDTMPLESGMHGQAPYFRQPFGIDLESATADNPVPRGRYQERGDPG